MALEGAYAGDVFLVSSNIVLSEYLQKQKKNQATNMENILPLGYTYITWAGKAEFSNSAIFPGGHILSQR